MNINDVYGDSVWLRAADLKGIKVRVKIADWDMTQFKNRDGSTKNQVVLTFVGKQKKLGLNVTNSKMIASMHGDDTEGWIGKEIVLMPTKTMDANGQLVDCIRIEYESQSAAPKMMVTQIGSTRATPRTAVKQMFDDRNPPPDDKIPEHSLGTEMNDEMPF
jgi:hypothetical protein